MTIDTIAARNAKIRHLTEANTVFAKRIKDLEAEVERRGEIIADATIRLDDRIKRAEFAEARVAELSKRGTRVGEKELGERCDRLERERDEARAKLAAADRLAEAMRNLKTLALESTDPGIDGTWVRHEDLLEVLAAYEAGEPVVHPDTEREPSEVEILRALDRSATRKRLDLESEIRELRKAEEWVRLIRMLASEYSGNMKLSKAIERVDEAIGSAREAESDG